jgi:hypothetical protein
MNSRLLFLPVVLVAMLLAGCASRVASYSGARRSPGQIATILIRDSEHDIRVVGVDGRAVNGRRADVEVLPGQRTIEVMYYPPKTAKSYPVRITFNAQAGHLYALTAKMLGGRDQGQGFWEGKYQAFLYDMQGVREVARSEGPGEAPPSANRG